MKYVYKIDNRMRDYGDTDTKKGIIRINKNLAQKKRRKAASGKTGHSKYPELLDSIVHETMHKDHPWMTEHMVRRKTKEKVKSLNPNEKAHYYSKLK